MFEHLVRVGCLGHVGRFWSIEPRDFTRGTRVVCRTARGVEVGEILTTVARRSEPHSCVETDFSTDLPNSRLPEATRPEPPPPASGSTSTAEPCDGTILRRVTVEDDLLLARLARHARAAYEACTGLLRERGLNDLLVDVEHLFDGRSIYFYFLGATSPEVERLTRELASTYEAQAQIGRFADALAAGCGPNCGTESAAGCGSGGCSTCAIAAACVK